jgi:5-methylcytosine-specific restriction protein A
MAKIKIEQDVLPVAYSIAKKVYYKDLKHTEGQKALAAGSRMSVSSAGDYIHVFRYLKDGERITRGLNAASIDYFMDRLYKDYGSPSLETSLKVLQKYIDYEEGRGKTKTTAHSLREILLKHEARMAGPQFVNTTAQIQENIQYLERTLIDGNEEERKETANIIKRGTCFVAYEVGGEIRFAPSRFIGYEHNKVFRFSHWDLDGRETNKVLISLLGSKPQLNGGAYGTTRKYWRLNLLQDGEGTEVRKGYSEGKMVERMHWARERNSKVIRVAKMNFKAKHGRLFCEVCDFDFKKVYGNLGIDFIEGHHIIPVKSMQPDHQTMPEDIAMLCANCHRMIHASAVWMEVRNLRKLLKRK